MGIWIDTDMGVDDLFAVLLALRHATVDGISLTFGNAPLPQVAANAAGAMAVFGWSTPISMGAERAVLGGLETAQRILGDSGMPTRGLSLPPVNAQFPPAVPALARWLKGQDDAQILALGPLTNLATLALAHPDLLDRIGRITWMGGAVGAGNHTASAEFNAYADPEALAILLARDVPITMVDLDICRQVQISEDDVTAATDPLLRDLLGGYLDIALSRGRPSMALYDPVAAAALLRPDLFDAAPVHLAVELCGQHTRGRTVTDRRGAEGQLAHILPGCDAKAVHALCMSVFTP
ncbi:nucleoside hydrolase [Oceaniglobus trochenteri]|uniref:nucleoside hydrolase n=1 Tax=Oceaniglobus trochenteri TaxID=2763260 RepID=UPI001CFFB936|nr:nucleoside hydrolase [Oceaniglobus trochenteri]